jgi:chloramphenicol-sensitive protein RarD
VSAHNGEGRAALFAGIGCYTFWGLVPLLFQLMKSTGASPVEIVAHRTFWSVFWAAGLVLLAGQAAEVRRVFRSPGVLGLLALSTLLITINWSLYVWAVTTGQALEASLGYYIIPLINMAAGALLFRERLDRFALVAVALAVVGVALQALAVGHLPWVALVLALSFGGYGIVRKRVKAEAQTGLFIECLLMVLPGALCLAWLQAHGQGHFLASPAAAATLFVAGPATVIPLALFAWAARRMPLSSMGFLQFLGPTITFFIGVAEGEPFGWLRAVSFLFIWAGAAVFGWGAWRAGRKAAERVAGAAATSEAQAAE